MSHLKQAFRQLGLRPGLSLSVIAMLALGIGATTAMFSLFHQILVHPLPVPEPEQLVNLASPGQKYGPNWGGESVIDGEATFTLEMFRDLEAQQNVFTGIAAHADFRVNLATGAGTIAGRGTLVSGSYFEVLGLAPALGRLITPQDEPRIDESPVVVLSHEYWQSQFGGDRSVIGRKLRVNGQELEIIGVAPAGFSGTALGWRPQVFVPVTLRWLLQPTMGRDYGSRRTYWLYLFARLVPAVTAERAAAELNALYGAILRDVEAPMLTSLAGDQMQRFLERRVEVEPGARGQSHLPSMAGRPMTLLFAVAGLLVLIVCVNVANLLLARGVARAGEIAVRAAVGASRSRLLGQLLTEALLLAAIGGALGLLVAAATLRAVAALLPEAIASGLAIELSADAMLFAGAASIGTVLLFGLAPAWRASDTDAGRVLNGGAARTSSSRGAVVFRSALSAVQVALSLVLLVLAGLFTQSLANVTRVNLGFDAEALVGFSVSPRSNGYTAEEGRALYERLEETLEADPGVTGVAGAVIPLVASSAMGFQVSGPGFQWQPGVNNFSVANAVTPGFFDTVAMPLVAGRSFTAADVSGAQNVAIVNERFVRRFGLGGDAVGTTIDIEFMRENVEIVGVVGDAKYSEVKRDVDPLFFMPLAQWGDVPTLHYYVRSGIGTDAALRMIARVVAGIDPQLPVSNLRAVESQIADNIYLDRLTALLAAAFGTLATVLAAFGLYGVLAYNVTERTRELGLRLALGATPGDLRAMVLKQVGIVALIGAGVGIAAAIGLGRVAESLLFGLSGRDPAVLATALAVLAVVVLAASYVPARRASSIAPMTALRYE
jgi:predicted permease